jgi:hypothetical protein
MKMHNLLDILYSADHGFNYLYVITREADHFRMTSVPGVTSRETQLLGTVTPFRSNGGNGVSY